MERLSSSLSLAALLATAVITSAVAQTQSDTPPARGARLGLAIAPLDENWRESNAYQASGLMVVGVDPRGRAATSGIVAGDVLVSVGNRTMREPSDLGRAERSLSPDQAVSVTLARDGGRSIKILQIAPVSAAPAVVAVPAAAPNPPAVVPSTDPAPPPAVPATIAVLDTASPPAVVSAIEPAPLAPVATTTSASDTSSRPVATSDAASPSAAASATASPPASSSPSVSDADTTSGQRSAALLAAPSATSAAPSGTTASAGGATSAPAALAAPAAIAVVPVAAAAVEPGTPPASSATTTDSVGASAESAEPASDVLGVIGKPLTPDLATALGATGVEGLLVLELTDASPAARAGLRAGDIIVKVGEQPVSDMGELQRAAAASATPVSISTLRLGKPRVELVSLEGPPPVPVAPPSQEQLLVELRDEVRSLRREVQSLRKKLGK